MNEYINIIYNLAKKGAKKGEVPIGCIIVQNNKIVSKAFNSKNSKHLVTDHAEIKAILKANRKLKDWRLDNCEMYVTLKPCNMCMEVIRQSRIKHVYYLLDSRFDNELKKEINYEKIESDYEKQYLRLIQDFFHNKR